VVSCSEPKISISSETSISREKLGYMVISIDVTCVLLSALFIWYLEYNIKAHLKVHEKQSIQTKDFALTFNNLPQVKGRSKLTVKAQLFNHIL
jgi:cytochrome c biogenesis factor